MAGASFDHFPDWLIGGHEMGQRIRDFDWSQTPLGAREQWPTTLRTTISLVLNSTFPLALMWGPEHTLLYNDSYIPLCGSQHPDSLGQNFTHYWQSAWGIIGKSYEKALAGEAAFLEDQQLFIDRRGYLEETFFTASFSPIRDESGCVVGVFHPVTESTSKILSQRRNRLLRELAICSHHSTYIETCLQHAAKVLAPAQQDLPFSLFYRLDRHLTMARLVAYTGIEANTAASPLVIDLQRAHHRIWPLRDTALGGYGLRLQDLNDRFSGLLLGPYPESVTQALLLPITPAGYDSPCCIIIAGISSRLPFNESYRSFYDLLASGLSTLIANAATHESEQQRIAALAAIDQSKNLFFNKISHEFRTPLTLLLAPLEDELNQHGDALPPTRRKRLNIAHRNGLRLLKLVNTLLDFTRLETGRAKANFEATNLSSLTIELASSFRLPCERAGLMLEIHCPELGEPVYVDPDMWEKIVLNLLSNAFKFTLTGSIYINLNTLGPHAVLTVTDTGCGINPEDLPHIFDSFYHCTNTISRSHEGAGMGLALVREMVRIHGGELQITSTPQIGSSFQISLPLGYKHLPKEQIRQQRLTSDVMSHAKPFVAEVLRWLPDPDEPILVSQPAATHHKHRPRIVWADDNVDMRKYVLRLLRQDYDVEAVANGEEALAAILRQPPALILSDVMMPVMDGFELLKAIRKNEKTRTTPFILLSARAGEEARIEGLQAGADDYLVKPFSGKELQAKISSYVGLALLREETEQARREAERIEMLAASEAQLRMITDAVPALISYLDADERYVFNNLAYEHWFNRPRHSLYGQRIRDLLPAEAYQKVVPYIQKVLSGSPASYETEARYHDGSIHNVHVSYVPDFGADNRVKGFFALITDTTEAKKAADALRASEQRYLTALNTMLEGCQIISHDWRYLYLNDSAIRHSHLSREFLIGKTMMEVYPQIEETEVFQLLKQCMNDRQSARMENSFVYPDGSNAWFDLSIQPVDEGLFILSIDITERKMAEEAMRESESQFRLLAETVPQMIWTCTTDGVCDFLSPQWQTYTGIPTAQLLGNFWLELVHPDDRSTIIQLRDNLSSHYQRQTEVRLRHHDGNYHWFDVRVVPVLNSQHEIIKWVGSHTDITERKETEQIQLRTQKMEALGTLAGGIAHDFNNILLAISGNTKLAIEDLPQAHPVQEFLDEVRKASERASSLVKRILSFSRQEEPCRETTFVTPIVEEATKLLRATLPAMIQMRVECEDNLPPIKADSTQLHQILLNLGTNAAYAMGTRAGYLDFKLHRVQAPNNGLPTVLAQGRYLCLEVKDTGSGIDAKTLARIFDPFFTTKPQGVGTGLGLSVVDSIVKSHGGVITVDSELGKGTTFRLYFPTIDAPIEAQKPVAPTMMGQHKERVLYVDDEEALVYLTARVLQKQGYQVTGFTDPQEALAIFRDHSHDFDVVVSDLAMPILSGFDLARELLLIRPDLIIVLTSGYVRREDMETAEQIGIKSVILKPNTVNELGATLDKLLNELKPPA